MNRSSDSSSDPLLRFLPEFPIHRPGMGIRMSPPSYTEDAELDRAFEAIDDIRATGSWRRWRQRPSLVT